MFTPRLFNQTIKRYAMSLVLLALLLLGLVDKSHAVYVNRYSTTTNGAIVFTGNTLGLDGSATYAVAGTQGGIGAFTSLNTALSYGNFGVGTTNDWTQNGSRAVLTIPAGSTILYAEVIWGGTVNSNQDVSASINNNITFDSPLGTYSIAPAAATSQLVGVQGRYVRSANVTGLIQLGGSGNYSVRGVPSSYGPGSANSAGWTLAVVYGNPSLPPRNLSVFVGAEPGGNPATGVSGFCTNVAGPVKGRLLVSATEGDAGITGDTMLFGPNTSSMVALSGPNNPETNFFSGQINNSSGALDTSGSFGTQNHVPGAPVNGARQGWDITNVDVSPALVNSQTSAVAQGTTTGDQYGIVALGIQIDVGAPKFPLTVKTANRTTTYVGDTVTYSISLDNTTGTANATNVVFSDQLSPGMSFIPGTVTVNGISQPSFNPVSGFNMGTINAGSIGTVTFQVQVNALPASPALAEYSSKARWTYDFISCAGFPAEQGVVETNPNIIKAIRLNPSKSVSPTGVVSVNQQLTYTVTAANTGEVATTAATLADPIPAGTTYVPNSTTMNGLAVPDISGAMPFATSGLINALGRPAGVINSGESAVIQFRVTVNPSPPTIITNIAVIDPDGSGAAPGQSVQAVNTPLLGPLVAKAFSPALVNAGAMSQLTITLTNPNGAALTSAAFSDTLPAGITLSATPNATTTCPGGTAVALPSGITLGLSSGTIPSNGSCTVTATVLAASVGTFLNRIAAGSVSTANGGNNIAEATASISVSQGPSLNKSFSPSTIATGGTSTLSISIVNPTSTAMTAVSLNDALPSGMTIGATPSVTNSCGGTVVATAGGSSIALTGGSVPAANVCTITVNVTASAVGNYTNTIPIGALSSSAGTNTVAATADLNVAAPLISKSFSANPIAVNTASVLTITLANPTPTAITGAAFTDIFPTSPAQMVLSNTTTSNTCGGTITNNLGTALAANNVGIRLTGATIPASGTCTLTVRVQAPVGGNYLNTIPAGGLTTANGGSNTVAAQATLSVGLPSVTKSFGTIAVPQTTMFAGQVVPLQIRLANPNATALAVTSLTDVFPSGMTLANTTVTNACGGTMTSDTGAALAVGNGGIRLTGGSIPANSNCLLSVNVTASTPGDYTNTIAADQLITPAGNNAFPTSDMITLLQRPSITKVFGATSISPTGTTSLTITLWNNNATTITGAAFTDTFPTSPGGMTLANGTFSNTCGGTLTGLPSGAPAAGNTGIALTGGIIPGGGSCVITVTVTASVAGNYTNTIAAGGLTSTNASSNPSPTSANLTVAVLAPSASKAFSPAVLGRGQITRITITLVNSNVATSLTGVAINDPLPQVPGSLFIAPTPNLSLTGCGSPTTSAVPGATTFTMTGASIAANASCVIAFDALTNIAGNYTNVTGSVSSGNGGTGNQATALLTVLFPPTVAKSFSASPIAANNPTVLTIAISNPNAAASLTGVAVSDSYPLGMVNTASPNPSVSCSSGSSASFTGGAANGTTIGLSGATIAPGGFCSVTVNVTAAANGNYDNITGTVTSTNAGSGATSLARLVVGLRVAGRVFNDNGSGGGVANDGQLNGNEQGLGGVTLKLTNCAATVYETTTTDPIGFYSLSIPPSAISGTQLCVVETNPSSYTSTGASVGTTGGTYNRTTDTISFSYVANTAPSGVNFGDVAANVFTSDGMNAIAAGASVNYPHSFTAATGGTVSFASTSVANPAITGWSEIIYRDTNCNGTLDAGEPVLSSAVTVAAGDQVCIVVKVFSPGGAPNGAQYVTTTTAVFNYTNAAPTLSASYQRGDTTTVGQAGLTLIKTVDRPTALPGELLTYTVTYRNDSSGPVTSVVINDTTPAFTQFQSASCGSNPPVITTCSVTSQPALNGSGAIVWTLGGSLSPAGQSTVTFVVRVQP